MTDEMHSVLIADDHPVVVNGLSASLQEWFRIAGTVSSLETLDAGLTQHQPDVVLLDISFGDRSSLRLLPALVTAHPATRFLMLTAHVERVLVDAALSNGARGFVAKESPISEIRMAINEVLAGRRYVTPMVRARRGDSLDADAMDPPDLVRPSERQLEILSLLRDGATHREIATKVGISTKTVEYHLNSLRQRLGVASTGLLIRWAQGFKDREVGRTVRPRRQEPPPGL